MKRLAEGGGRFGEGNIYSASLLRYRSFVQNFWGSLRHQEIRVSHVVAAYVVRGRGMKDADEGEIL